MWAQTISYVFVTSTSGEKPDVKKSDGDEEKRQKQDESKSDEGQIIAKNMTIDELLHLRRKHLTEKRRRIHHFFNQITNWRQM